MKSSYRLMLVFLLSLGGCSTQDDDGQAPDVLQIGILPDESEEILLKRYTPLFQYISNEIGIPYNLKLSKNYDALLKQFKDGEVDLAYFGGFTFLQAHHKAKAVPLVMRDIDIRFTSYFICNTDTALNKITDFKNKTFSFGSKLSTSGHLMPRYFLGEEKIIPDKFFSNIKYSGSHDKTAYWVRDAIVDVGVANSKIIDTMLTDGRLKKTDIKILWETPPYPDYVWAIQSVYSEALQIKIRNAFLSLTPSNIEHAKILSGIDAGVFLPASVEDFDRLDEIALQYGLF